MKMNLIADARLAQLAWCVTLSKRNLEAEVRVGSHVEVVDNHLFEGAWSGDYTTLDFSHALTFTGTGCIIGDNSLIVCTPTHPLAPIYTLRKNKSLHVSNSLVTILMVAGEKLDTEHPHYDSDIMSVIFGVDRYTKNIPTARCRSIHLHYVKNIEIFRDLTMREYEKDTPLSFNDFTAYDRFISGEVRQVILNATDNNRRTQFVPLTTISRGYDSPACAVWARRAGTNDAFTIAEARDAFSNADDSGKTIAEVLNLKVTELSREISGTPQRPDAELEILSSGYGGDDLIWVGAEPFLTGRLLLTGQHGDKVWSMQSTAVTTTFERGGPSGNSLLEFRLSIGFLNFPIPFAGCIHHSDIWKISISDEMKAWSVGGKYDRPIPRRIVEMAGVGRDQFGQSKKAVANPYQDTDAENPPLEKVLSQNTLNRFRSADRGRKKFLRRRIVSWKFRVFRKFMFSYKVRGIAQRLGASKWLEYARWKYRSPLTEHHFVTAWAANALIEERSKKGGCELTVLPAKEVGAIAQPLR